MSFQCRICNKYCRDQLSLIQHTENSHGRHGVYKGVKAWERSRRQNCEITTRGFVNEYSYEIDDDNYDNYRDEWVCDFCDRGFVSSHALLQHLTSGAHEEHRYECDNCFRSFPSLSSLTMHLNSTGHSRREERLVRTLINDAQNMNILRITNQSSNYLPIEATLKFDGSARPNPGNGGAGWVLYDDCGNEILSDGESVPYYNVTNNQAEYYGLICGLKAARSEGIKRLLVEGDSQLVIKQMTGDYNVNSGNLINYYNEAKQLCNYFQVIRFGHIDRRYNQVADSLSKQYV